MLTRGNVQHAYTPTPVVHTIAHGVVKHTVGRGINQTWAISRPVSAPHSGMIGPMHTIESQTPYVPIVRGGFMGLAMPQPKLEADLTNSATWQRPYRKDTR